MMDNPYRLKAMEIRRLIATAASAERADHLRDVARMYDIFAGEFDRASTGGEQQRHSSREQRRT
jgi:hypothetical protein